MRLPWAGGEEIAGLICEKLQMTVGLMEDQAVQRTFCPLLSGGWLGEAECEIRREDAAVIPVGLCLISFARSCSRRD